MLPYHAVTGKSPVSRLHAFTPSRRHAVTPSRAPAGTLTHRETRKHEIQAGAMYFVYLVPFVRLRWLTATESGRPGDGATTDPLGRTSNRSDGGRPTREGNGRCRKCRRSMRHSLAQAPTLETSPLSRSGYAEPGNPRLQRDGVAVGLRAARRNGCRFPLVRWHGMRNGVGKPVTEL